MSKVSLNSRVINSFIFSAWENLCQKTNKQKTKTKKKLNKNKQNPNQTNKKLKKKPPQREEKIIFKYKPQQNSVFIWVENKG